MEIIKMLGLKIYNSKLDSIIECCFIDIFREVRDQELRKFAQEGIINYEY